ncbi:MAG: aldehyde dehydrogenase family protein [Flavobacteriales bacterium]|nr:aldehyde dehydrogenase family protein [Flavobacteriales bacterium]MDW8432429.1 aldehyde dehydrogenase family protein [Flavobacteriales bacterium]
MSERSFFLLIGGELTAGATAQSMYCPWDGQWIGMAPVAGEEEALRALEKADTASRVLAELPLYQRAELLMNTARRVEEKAESLAQLIALEAAKPLFLARTEVQRAIFGFRTAAEECLRPEAEWIRLDRTPQGTGMEALLKRFPRGVVLAISPFNFPLNLAVHKIAPALAAGCPVIAKPASATPLTLLALGQEMADLGWPEGSISILNMPGRLAEKMAGDPRVAVVSFTGSDAVGWRLKELFPRKHFTLELGGNAAAYIAESANLEEALRQCLPAAFNYSGQVCIHLQRLYVHSRHFETVSQAFVQYASALQPERPDTEDCRFSCMISEAEARRVESWVNEAREEGVRLLTPLRRESAVMFPTVLTGSRKGHKVRDEEVFGPVVCVEPVQDFEEALGQIQDSRFGLQASLFTDSLSEMNAFFRTVRAGNLLVNRAPGFRLDHMPFGGLKDSGTGLEGIRYAMRSFSEERLCIKPF